MLWRGGRKLVLERSNCMITKHFLLDVRGCLCRIGNVVYLIRFVEGVYVTTWRGVVGLRVSRSRHFTAYFNVTILSAISIFKNLELLFCGLHTWNRSLLVAWCVLAEVCHWCCFHTTSFRTFLLLIQVSIPHLYCRYQLWIRSCTFHNTVLAVVFAYLLWQLWDILREILLLRGFRSLLRWIWGNISGSLDLSRVACCCLFCWFYAHLAQAESSSNSTHGISVVWTCVALDVKLVCLCVYRFD